MITTADGEIGDPDRRAAFSLCWLRSLLWLEASKRTWFILRQLSRTETLAANPPLRSGDFHSGKLLTL